MSQDLFAPPTPEELAKAKPQQDLFAPPTNDEIKRVTAAKPSAAESLMRGAAQGASFGLADEATAGVGALYDYVQGKLGSRGDISLGDAYRTRRDSIRAADDRAKVENPKAFIGGTVAGAVGAGLSPAGAVFGPSAGASFLGNVGRAFIGGTVAGAGYSNADPTESPAKLKEFAKDTAIGGAVGGGAQAAFGLLGKAADSLRPSSLREVAAEKAVKAAGGMTKELRDLGPERVQSLGKELLDKKVVTALSSLEDVAERAAAQKETAGQAIGSALENVDSLVQTGKQLIDDGAIFPGLPEAGKKAAKDMLDQHFQFSMTRVGKRIEQELIEPNANNPLLRGELAKLQSIADDFKEGAAQTLKAGNVIKGTQGRVTNFNSDTVPQAFKQELYGVIKTELEDVIAKTGNLEQAILKGSGNALGSVDAAARGGAASDAYQAAKSTYGNMARTEEMALKSLGRTSANRSISLTDTIAGIGGMAKGGPVLGLALGAGNKLVRQYGDSLAAVGASKLADVIERAPQVLGRFGPVLDQAAKHGSLPTVHLELMKDPDYRRMIDNLEKQSAIQRRLGATKP